MLHTNENPAAGDDGARQEIQSGRIGPAVNSQTKTKVKHTAGIAVASADEDNDCLYLAIELNNDCAVVLTFPKNTSETPYVAIWQCAPKARIISGGRFHPESCRLIRKLTSGLVGNRLGWSLVTKVALGG
jgi:hypothetical protein